MAARVPQSQYTVSGAGLSVLLLLPMASLYAVLRSLAADNDDLIVPLRS